MWGSAKKVSKALYAICKIHEFLVCTSLEKHPICAKVDKCPRVHSWKVCGRYFVVNCNSWTRVYNSKRTEPAAHNNFSVSGSFTHSKHSRGTWQNANEDFPKLWELRNRPVLYVQDGVNQIDPAIIVFQKSSTRSTWCTAKSPIFVDP